MKENKNEALVTPSLLIWARKKAGLSIEDVVEKIAVVPKILTSWEQGQARPTILEAQKLAEIYKVPFAAFFLPEPPKEEEKITLRKVINYIEDTLKNIEDYRYGFEEVLNETVSDLKQLEKQIKGLPGEVKEMRPHKTAFFYCTINWICKEILGEEGDMK